MTSDALAPKEQPADRDRARGLRASGKTVEHIALLLGCKFSDVEAHLKDKAKDDQPGD